jgi:hypothetical protein
MTEKLPIDQVLALKVRLSRGGQLWDGPVACEVVDAETGRILQWVNPIYSQLQQQSLRGSGTFIAYGQHDQAAFYYPDGLLAVRPRLWLSDQLAVAIGEAFSLPAPAGSFITYLRPSSEHRSGYLSQNFDLTEDETFAFETEVPGVYRLILRPPFPYQRQELQVTVS